jgi:hypothetical protein
MQTCKAPSCNQEVDSKELCHAHYVAVRRALIRKKLDPKTAGNDFSLLLHLVPKTRKLEPGEVYHPINTRIKQRVYEAIDNLAVTHQTSVYIEISNILDAWYEAHTSGRPAPVQREVPRPKPQAERLKIITSDVLSELADPTKTKPELKRSRRPGAVPAPAKRAK